MPPVALIALSAASVGLVGGAATIGAAVGLSAGLVSAIGVGIGLVGTLLQTLLQAQPPKPKFEDGTQNVKQAVPPRVRSYGRGRTGGAYVYYDTNDSGDLIMLLCHAAHLIQEVEQHWLFDSIVELDSGGGVTTGSYQLLGESFVFVTNYLGTPTQVVADMPGEWDPLLHKGHGLFLTRVKCSDGSVEQQQKIYPNGVPTYNATWKGALIYDPRDGAQVYGDETTYAWSDNAALVILDYMTRTEGSTIGPIPIGFGIDIADIDIASFISAANDCDAPINLAAGGTEPRWRLWGSYEMNEDRKNVLSDMMDCCGGRFIMNPQGNLGLTVGKGSPQSGVTITDDSIKNYSLDQGVAPTDLINEIRVTYLAEAQNWSKTEAGIQSDQASIDQFGVQSSASDLRFCPSEGQAQRIARYLLRRGNVRYSGTLTGSVAFLDAWGERWITLQSDELGLTQLCEIKAMRIVPGADDVSVEIDFMSYDDWWEWNAATDEQAPSLPPARAVRPADVPVPTGIVVNIDHRNIDVNTIVAVGIVSWTAPTRASLTSKGRWRKVGSSGWVIGAVNPGQYYFETGILEDGVIYETQIQNIGSKGSASDWAPTVPLQFTAVADPIAPGAPVGLTAVYSSGPGTALVTVTAPSDPHYASLWLQRGSTNVFSASSALAGPQYTGAGGTWTYTDTPPSPGNWYYWAIAKNRSNIASTPTGPQSIAVAPGAPAITTGAATIGNANPVVVGTSFSGATIRVYVDGVLNQTVTASGTNWTATLAGLALGARSITATQDIGSGVSPASAAVVLTRVWYDPQAAIEIDFPGQQYRISGTTTDASVSGWAGLFNATLSLPDQIFDKGGGLLRRAAAGVMPRDSNGMLYAQMTRTNVNTNFNLAPATGATTGLTKTGDPLGSLVCAADATEMALGCFADATLAAVVSGNAFRVVTTGASADTIVTISGAIGSVALSSAQICARGSGTFTVETDAGTPQTLITVAASSHYVRYVKDGYTPASTSELIRLRVPPGRDIWFIANQLEVGRRASGPIAIAGAAATRAAPLLQRTMGAEWNATEGYIGSRAAQAVNGAPNAVVYINQVDSTHRYYLQYPATTTLRAATQNSTNVALDKTGLVAAATLTSMHGYKINDVAFSVNGAAALTSTTVTLPTGTFTLNLLSSTNALEGVIHRWKAGTSKPTNANIQLMSGWDIS
jgi:hypothetical protein